MPVSIDEVTAEVTAPEAEDAAESRDEAQPATPLLEQRRYRALGERLHQRAARVSAD